MVQCIVPTPNMDYLYNMVSMGCENSNSKLIYLALALFHIDFALVVLGYEDKELRNQQVVFSPSTSCVPSLSLGL